MDELLPAESQDGGDRSVHRPGYDISSLHEYWTLLTHSLSGWEKVTEAARDHLWREAREAEQWQDESSQS